jgi:hypothetical protein
MKKLLAIATLLFGAALFTSAPASAQVYLRAPGVVVNVPAPVCYDAYGYAVPCYDSYYGYGYYGYPYGYGWDGYRGYRYDNRGFAPRGYRYDYRGYAPRGGNYAPRGGNYAPRGGNGGWHGGRH